ncbi:ATP-binding cassette domain-containing protein [Olsenella sp. YH-ols2217]|uniref:ATP-binding cassette domain-containing protein n=1 Tax=Kribbibacterium absianum TaxID=3044210 RepID=A0ABT6ZMH8_9ACTN|nr:MULTISPECIES: ATP-binding cassette domain-containing protein [unclassified Olsenella]MDJ1122326.1 ATP-binding cassette domain-containing protein [Olsenella sp. YH-ols2216]MDJ1130260.1 ATP-binding cassette domain-containing protein [Olsenella sp. YH-ols2217]
MTEKDRGRTAPAPASLALDLHGVGFSYDGGRTWALRDVDLAMRRGERVCLLGANGSGKSTLARVAAGLVAPDTGSVDILGVRCRDAESGIDPAAYRDARRGTRTEGHGVGMVFQSPDDQMVTTNVADDVAFGPENLCMPAAEITEVVGRELHRAAMEDLAGADPSQLSGGQQQRVAIASALALEPALLVLDEPSARLDARGRAAILRVLGRLATHSTGPGTAILHITHFMDEALLADRVVVLDRGAIVADGAPAEVLSRPDLLSQEGLEPTFASRLSAALSARGLRVAPTWDTDTLLAAVAALIGGGA